MQETGTRLEVTPAASRDRAVREADGRVRATGIAGVLVERPPRHVDERGSLFVAASVDHPFWSEPLVHAEWVVIAPGMIKGWGMHLESDDRYVSGSGRCRVVLFDGRVGSPTHESFAVHHFGDQSPLWLLIPRGVWHAVQNYGDADAVFINVPTATHRYDDPDKYRLDPYDRSKIDFDWTIRGG